MAPTENNLGRGLGKRGADRRRLASLCQLTGRGEKSGCRGQPSPALPRPRCIDVKAAEGPAQTSQSRNLAASAGHQRTDGLDEIRALASPGCLM